MPALLSLAKLRAGFDMQTNVAEHGVFSRRHSYLVGIDSAAPTTLPGPFAPLGCWTKATTRKFAGSAPCGILISISFEKSLPFFKLPICSKLWTTATWERRCPPFSPRKKSEERRVGKE